MRQALERCDLGNLIAKLDQVDRWDKELSLGEQERLAFARLLLHKPGWVFLDEATAALDEDSQSRVMGLFDAELKNTTVLSIGHRPDLAAYHTRTLQLVHGVNGDRLRLKPAPAPPPPAALAATARRLVERAMNILRLYGRVLALLGSESRLAWTLALANVALASAQFAEPVLLGRIIDTLTGAQSRGEPPSWSQLGMLLTAWAGFGLFTIACGTLIALYADRLAHRRRHVVLDRLFRARAAASAHLSRQHPFRPADESDAAGHDALWGLWVGFFRDHLSSFVSLLVLLPISLFINWRLASLLIVLCVVFAVLTALIVRKTHTLQSQVERHYSDLAERASDTLGNIALVQSFSRLEAEVTELRQIVTRLLAAQMPVLSWWALAVVLTRTSTTLTVLAIIIVGDAA